MLDMNMRAILLHPVRLARSIVVIELLLLLEVAIDDFLFLLRVGGNCMGTPTHLFSAIRQEDREEAEDAEGDPEPFGDFREFFECLVHCVARFVPGGFLTSPHI